MTKGKIDKATAIKSILSDLKKGIDRATILHKIAQKCTKDGSTLRRWFKEAEDQYKDYLDRVTPIKQKAEEEAVFEATKEIIRSGILSKAERMQLLSDIAEGKRKVWKQVSTLRGIETVESYDPVKYIAELNKMDGSYINDVETEEKINEIKITRIDGSKS